MGCMGARGGMGGMGGMGCMGGMGGMGGMAAQPMAMAPQAQAPMGPNSPKQGIPGDHRLYIFGIPPGLNADHLRGHFARHGEILDVHVPPRKPDNAYITFSDADELMDALANSGVRIAGFTVQGMKE